LISRQFGKSFVLCILAIEQCLNQSFSVVKYVCPKQKMVERIIKPRIREIIKDCPDHLKPEWKSQDKIWLFPNGSEIQVAGSDNGNYESIRGGSSHLCIVDEAGFVDDLDTVVFNVLSPTTDTTDGKVLLASTPNDKNPNHDFHESFVNPLDAAGKLLKFTYLDSPMLSDDKKANLHKKYPGGLTNKKFRCEYMCEIPNSSDSTVIPEFVTNYDKIVKEVPTPNYADFYVSMDIGFKDLTITLFAYYDFEVHKLVVIDEHVINGPELKTNVLSAAIKSKEEQRFFTTNGKESAYNRWMDNNNLL